ncbi:hypothetical protein HID58_076742 [Brassica napus]|uniref:Uncharacterized protein n=1 Tax=Brassica napus TaxID=3708 RepID=A0ABQ7YNC1_BRANA|nr:hypothetical protein HID58_076742 [Brassica napus]
MATKLFSPSLSCPWVTSRDVVIKGRRRDFVTKRNRVSPVTAMVVEPLSAVSSSAVQIHQWWEQNPSSLLFMAETGGGYSLASYYTSLGLFVISVPGLWSLIKRSVKSKASRKEEIKVKMMVGENGKLNEIVVQGDDVQVEEMRKDLQFSEKGMVYVKGLFERS